MDYRLTLGEGITLRVQADAHERLSPGAAVGLRLARARCWAMDESGREAP